MNPEVLEINYMNSYPFLHTHQHTHSHMTGAASFPSRVQKREELLKILALPSESALSNSVRKLSSHRQLEAAGLCAAEINLGLKG